MTIEAVHGFPPSFLWGTATSSHQVEGQNNNNDWADWERRQGRIAEGHRAGQACDWWSGRWQEDFDRAAGGHQNAHRLSLEWSRIEPQPGKWDQQALKRYREMLKGARARGLRPMVTLHHFTNPRWLVDKGGWSSEAVIPLFARYVGKVVAELGDLAALWVTINEPNVYAYAAHAAGAMPPGENNVNSALDVMLNMVRAHAAAYRVIHQLQPAAQVGLAHHYRSMVPARRLNPLDQVVRWLRSAVFNDAVPEAFTDGVLRFPWKKIPVPHAKGTQDFFGLNYYTREQVAFSLSSVHELFGRGYYPTGADLSPTGFIANEPEGFRQALRWAHRFGLPFYVTENGVEDADDHLRRRYLVLHMKELWRAANFNWQVKGYFHWTLVDNFEWDRGWTQPFGLWELDRESQARRKRPSADLFAAICEQNALSAAMVRQHAPEVFDQIFPHDPPGELPPTSS